MRRIFEEAVIRGHCHNKKHYNSWQISNILIVKHEVNKNWVIFYQKIR